MLALFAVLAITSEASADTMLIDLNLVLPPEQSPPPGPCDQNLPVLSLPAGLQPLTYGTSLDLCVSGTLTIYAPTGISGNTLALSASNTIEITGPIPAAVPIPVCSPSGCPST